MLMEIDENRADLTEIERSEHLMARQTIHEGLYPNNRRGVAGGEAKRVQEVVRPKAAPASEPRPPRQRTRKPHGDCGRPRPNNGSDEMLDRFQKLWLESGRGRLVPEANATMKLRFGKGLGHGAPVQRGKGGPGRQRTAAKEPAN